MDVFGFAGGLLPAAPTAFGSGLEAAEGGATGAGKAGGRAGEGRLDGMGLGCSYSLTPPSDDDGHAPLAALVHHHLHAAVDVRSPGAAVA